MELQNDAVEKFFIGCLPQLPEVAANFIDLTRKLNTSKTSYANLLLSEPVLSTRIFSYINLVLNPSNSGYLSINKGISIMGLHGFKNIVIAFSLFPSFQDADCTALYKHSLLCAYYSSAIASQFNFINQHDAFLLGFLHDIGKLALKNRFGDEYKISDNVNTIPENEFSCSDEIEKFGYSHSDISEFICNHWNLPAVISDAVKFHHSPFDAMLPQAAAIIFLSQMLANQNTAGVQETQRVLQYMRLSKSDLFPYIDGSSRKLQPFFEILGI